jgi:hypothetical protein
MPSGGIAEALLADAELRSMMSACFASSDAVASRMRVLKVPRIRTPIR